MTGNLARYEWRFPANSKGSRIEQQIWAKRVNAEHPYQRQTAVTLLASRLRTDQVKRRIN